MNKEKKIVKIRDDVLIGKAGDRDLLGDLFIPPDNNSSKPAIVDYPWRWLDGRR